jgi:prepilin-type N-terminal cleavage/methylation domain-containing protein
MNKNKGFSLVELVVVIMILGILAAVAAPKLFSTSGNATDNGLRQTLTVIRDAIDLYAADHEGDLPPCTMTGADFRTALEPYLRGTFPKCPVGPADNNNVIPVTGTGAAGVAMPSDGWKFNTDDGTFVCNYSGESNTDGVMYDDF